MTSKPNIFMTSKNKKPLELKFSDLKEEEKQKYMQFLLTNNIFFEEEKENNNYVATIKFTQQAEDSLCQNLQKNEDHHKKQKGENCKKQFNDAFAIAGSFSTLPTHNIKQKNRKELKEIQNIHGIYFRFLLHKSVLRRK